MILPSRTVDSIVLNNERRYLAMDDVIAWLLLIAVTKPDELVDKRTLLTEIATAMANTEHVSKRG